MGRVMTGRWVLVTTFTLLVLAATMVQGCGVQRRKIETLEARRVAATIALSRSEIEEERRIIQAPRRDTLRVVDPEGREVLIMKAVRDEASGEMVAHEVLDAAVITARFRNVAERHGRIDLRFEIIVPREMQDLRWQLRFYPDMYILEDSVRLQSVVITGDEYRRSQLEQLQREVMDLEDGVQVLWKKGIYAESGMGCTGPIIRVSDANLEKAKEILTAEGYIG